ncbi:Glutathione S-transferase [Gracilaria domingensis]|nr:Glutathione S-transferase [Gracilaria domingensis]
MEQVKLIYFDYPGHAEAIRLALRIGKIPFEDVRIHPSEVGTTEVDLPYGSLPTLVVGGESYSHSPAILRYVGKKTGLYPEDDLVALRVDEIIDTVLDFFYGLEAIENKNAESYLDEVKNYLEDNVPRYLGGLDSRLEKFGDGPWAVGDSISIADLVIYVCVLYTQAEAFDQLTFAQVAHYSRLQESAEAVLQNPQVIKWNEYIAEKRAKVKESQTPEDISV